jgi:hypothetical protein
VNQLRPGLARVWMPDPKCPGKHIDPTTRIRPTSEWGAWCERGFVSNARFSSTDRVIPRTNRQTTRKWIRSSTTTTSTRTGGDK